MIILFIHLPHLLLLSFSVCTDVKTKLFCILHDLLITVVIVVLKNTFNAVNRYDLVSIGTDFQKGRSAHALLFPGGSAELILEDPDDLENTGVEVKAQPKGKRLTTLPLREVTEIPKPEPEPEAEEQAEDAELSAGETVTQSETISDNTDSSEENTHPTASEPSLFDFDD